MHLLDEFISLLELLYRDYLDKPLEGQEHDNKPNPEMLHPEITDDDVIDWQFLSPDTVGKAELRVKCNEISSPIKNYNDKNIYRLNHGLAHAVRTMSYVSMVVKYYSLFGTPYLREKAHDFLNEAALKRLMLTAAFLSIARSSEVDWSIQPGAHHYYRTQAGKIFEDSYAFYKRGENKYNLFSLFQTDSEFNHYRDALVALGDDQNDDPVHVILNSCHKLDLYRCRGKTHAQISVDAYFRQHSVGNYGNALLMLIQYAIESLTVTGNKLVSKNKDYNFDVFLPCNSSPKKAISEISKIDMPQLEPNDTNDPWRLPFFYKSISVYHQCWPDFLRRVTNSPVNNEAWLSLRGGIKNKFTNKMRRNSSSLPTDSSQRYSWVVEERAKGMPMYTDSEKKYFTSPYSFSYANPLQRYEPPVYCSHQDDPNLLVGVRVNVGKFLVNRITRYQGFSYNRIFDFETLEKSLHVLNEHLTNHFYFNSLQDLVNNLAPTYLNEILGRANSFDAIFLFSNNLKSRLLAQVMAREYEKRWLDCVNERYGVSLPQDYEIPIQYYLPDDELYHLKLYAKEAQQADRLAAIQADNSELNGYLDQLKKIITQPSFMESQRIHDVHMLAASGKVNQLQHLFINQPSLLNIVTATGKSCAHYAALNGQLTVLTLLFESNAIMSNGDENDVTPLIAAVYKKNVDAQLMLLEKVGINSLIELSEVINAWYKSSSTIQFDCLINSCLVDVFRLIRGAGDFLDVLGKVPASKKYRFVSSRSAIAWIDNNVDINFIIAIIKSLPSACRLRYVEDETVFKWVTALVQDRNLFFPLFLCFEENARRVLFTKLTRVRYPDLYHDERKLFPWVKLLPINNKVDFFVSEFKDCGVRLMLRYLFPHSNNLRPAASLIDQKANSIFQNIIKCVNNNGRGKFKKFFFKENNAATPHLLMLYLIPNLIANIEARIELNGKMESYNALLILISAVIKTPGLNHSCLKNINDYFSRLLDVLHKPEGLTAVPG